MAIAFKPTEYPAARREAITGMKRPQQRNLRRHRYFSPADSWPSSMSEAGTLALMLVFQCLAERGVPPATAHGMASSAATLICWWAQLHPGAVADPDNLNELSETPLAALGTLPSYFIWTGSKPYHLRTLGEFYDSDA